MATRLENPYQSSSRQPHVWLRGNVHAHTTLSDGKRTPQELIDIYAKNGYDFLALTDHDRLSDASALDARGLILLPGCCEITANGPHLLQLGANHAVEPHPDRQTVIDEVNRKNGLPVLCHPNWQATFDHWSFNAMRNLRDAVGVEIFNTGCWFDAGSGFALDKWDRLLSAGFSLWGFATDDCHREREDCGGWIAALVPSDNRTPEAIFDALRRGAFYASTGVTIERIEVEGTRLSVFAPDAECIEIISDNGMHLLRVDGNELVFDAAEVDRQYLRVECRGHGHRVAWTQPFFLRGGLAEHRRELEQTFQRPENRPALKALHVQKTLAPDDNRWREAQAHERFFCLPSGAEPDVKTSVRSALTATHLQFLIRCEEPLMSQMRVKIHEDDNSSLWTDESIELFLDIDRTGGQHCYQLIVNPCGCRAAMQPLKWQKHLDWSCQATQDATGWTAQITILLASLGTPAVRPDPARWGLHVCRNRPVAKKIYVLNWLSYNHDAERYGSLVLA